MRKGIEIVTVSHVDAVLREALLIPSHADYLAMIDERTHRYEDLYGKEEDEKKDKRPAASDPETEKESGLIAH